MWCFESSEFAEIVEVDINADIIREHIINYDNNEKSLSSSILFNVYLCRRVLPCGGSLIAKQLAKNI